MNSIYKNKITTGSLLKFAIPSIVMMMCLACYTIVDGIFVSRLIGTNAFSAVNIVYPFFSIVVALGTMFGTGATAVIAKNMGEGHFQKARENMTFIIVFTIILSVCIAAMGFLFIKPIINILGANEDVFSYCIQYAFVLMFFLPAHMLQMQFQCLFIADGHPNIGLVVTILGGVINIVLDYVFIAIFDMGIGGAALATGIGYSIPAIFGLMYFSLHRSGNLHFTKLKPDYKMLVGSMGNGSSEMVTNLATSITTLMFNRIMMHFLGADGVAAIGIVLYLDFILIAVSLGYSMGVAPVISYHYGSGDTDKLRAVYKISIRFSVVFGVAVTIITSLFAKPLTAIFTPTTSPVFELASVGLMIYAFGYLFKGYNIFASALFTAFSNGKVSAIISFMRTLVFLVGAITVLTVLLGVDGIWYAMPCAEVLSIVISIYFIKKYKSVYRY